jgi:cbb3-type cytochrome oxidase subunit 3
MTAPVIAPSLLFMVAALVGLAAVTLVRNRLASFATAVLLALIMAAAWWVWSTEQRANLAQATQHLLDSGRVHKSVYAVRDRP